jgi:hypothetical protein
MRLFHQSIKRKEINLMVKKIEQCGAPFAWGMGRHFRVD